MQTGGDKVFVLESNELGKITISKEAVQTVVGMATVECYGLVGMIPRKVSNGLTSILGLESIRKGVEVNETPEGVEVDVYVVVSYGTKISEVGYNVMQKIKYVMEKITGIPVTRVNVNVQGVKVAKE
ncbi:MAG: Asp23/Gls24 family envelope stress response protein [Syntrophomonadaceae bacterium]|nr:Asp23/Gls24 family envelope stress response protein [Syntrophomonadaceae bacterium]